MLLFFYHDEIRVDFNYVMRPLIKKKKKKHVRKLDADGLNFS